MLNYTPGAGHSEDHFLFSAPFAKTDRNAVAQPLPLNELSFTLSFFSLVNKSVFLLVMDVRQRTMTINGSIFFPGTLLFPFHSFLLPYKL